MHTITRNSVATNSRIATNLIHYFAMLEIVEKLLLHHFEHRSITRLIRCLFLINEFRRIFVARTSLLTVYMYS